VAVYSDADTQARHVQACDEAVHVGGNAPADSYLQWPRIIEAAKATGATAIHPGYGFLSENEDFAKACTLAGLVFIGPPASAIAAMGSKAAAKALMEKAGVPLVPGYHGDNNDPAFLQAQADAMGYPVLIKASAGGGGKGMRRVERSEDFIAALASCQREAKASFGDDHVLVERYVTRPRHIEIQVFADTQGQAVYLFERDCSVQRRHQKVLEEAPAPGLTEARRAEMGAAAVAAAQAVGYVGAGTVEFIAEPTADGDLRFYFMEMNTRLQVEHPVTEAITGLDLVEWQLRVAAGQPLPLQQAQLQRRGHAIEARICAENPDAGFLPATGTLQVARWPAHVRFERSDHLARLDAGVDEGDTISPHYDSMVAKLIVWGEDRAQALARLDAALRNTQILGLQTNVAFLRRVVQSTAFANADLDTALIERERDALFAPSALPVEQALAAVAAAHLQALADAAGRDPFSHRDGWRLHGPARHRMEVLELGTETTHHAEVLQGKGAGPTGVELSYGGQRWPLRWTRRDADTWDLHWGSRRESVQVLSHDDVRAVFSTAGSRVLRWVDRGAAGAAAEGHGGGLKAPMPGKVVAFLAQVGDAVHAGQAVAVMEAMKMEHTLVAPRDGVVASLLYAPGDQVAEGAELVQLAEAKAA
jgi:3-methylcrotonyl-CoA carboxylase alpha subunit